MLKVIWNTKLLLLNNKSLNDLLINEICIKIVIKLSTECKCYNKYSM